jgi:hypothetical protein
MQARFLQTAIARGSVQRVIWGLDFADFLAYRRPSTDPGVWPPPAKAFEAELQIRADGTENPAFRRSRLLARLKVLFSLDALKDSLSTALLQGEANASNRRADGFNPARDYIDIVEHEGQSVLFMQKNRETAVELGNSSRRLYPEGRRWSLELESVRRLLQFAAGRGVEVILFINPYHADYLMTIELGGKWMMFEEWKRTLSRLAQAEQVPLWDFNAFDQRSSETPRGPASADAILPWFWEPAHYRSRLGNLLLTTMMGWRCASTTVPMGTRLTRANVDAALRDLRADKRRYMSSHHERVALLSRLFR